MGKKQLIWASLLVLLLGIPVMVHAKMHIPFFGHSKHKTTQAPSELARTEGSSQTSPYRSGWDAGYKSGYDGGKADYSNGAKFDEDDAPGHKSGHAFCESIEGKGEHQCRSAYREAFKLGYQDGYSGLMSRLVTPEQSAQPQAEARAIEPPSQPEVQAEPEQPSTAMQETPEQPSTSPSESSQAQNQPSDNLRARNQPRALPRTGSSLPLFGLMGIGAIGLSFVFRAVRKTAEGHIA